MVLSPKLEKNDPDPYLMSYFVRSTTSVVFAALPATTRSKVTGFVLDLSVALVF